MLIVKTQDFEVGSHVSLPACVAVMVTSLLPCLMSSTYTPFSFFTSAIELSLDENVTGNSLSAVAEMVMLSVVAISSLSPRFQWICWVRPVTVALIGTTRVSFLFLITIALFSSPLFLPVQLILTTSPFFVEPQPEPNVRVCNSNWSLGFCNPTSSTPEISE